jgi:hypothetical protein
MNMTILQNALALVRELKTEEIEIISGGTYEGSGPDIRVTLTTCSQTVTTEQGPVTVTYPDDATTYVTAD